jgi:hypothetical protein
MSQLERTAEGLEDVYLSLVNQWQNTQELWLDVYRSEFERSFWLEMEDAIKNSLDDFRRFAKVAEQAQQQLQ